MPVGMDIDRKLALADPSGFAEAQRDLSVSFQKVGNVKRSQGDLAGRWRRTSPGWRSIKSCRLPIRAAQAQRDLSVDFNKIGNIKRWQGDLAGALSSYQSGLEIRRKLSSANPPDKRKGAAQPVGQLREGRQREAFAGDLAGALESYQSGLEIDRKLLSSADPSSAAQHNLLRRLWQNRQREVFTG